MTKEIEEYFIEKYMQQDIRVVPGHWPDFRSKEEVDKWIKGMNDLMDYCTSKDN